MKKLDIILTIILVAVFLPLSFWGGSQEWAGETDSLAFILLFVGAAYIIFEGVRISSPFLCTVFGGLVPLLIVTPSIFVYRNADIEEAIIMVGVGCIIGFVASFASLLVKKNKKERMSAQSMSANQAGTQAMGAQGSAAPSLVGINGWLLLLAIGIPLGSLLYVINIIQSLVFRFSSDYADVASQYGGVGFLTTFELLGKIGLFIYLCIIAYTFYKQKKSIPKRVITYLIASLIFAAIRFVWGIIIFGMDDEAVLISLLRSTGIISIIIASAVWIPYFKKSQRVKLTFVNA